MSVAPVVAAFVEKGALLWTPSVEFAEPSQLRAFERWLESNRDLRFADFDALWRSSVAQG